jgi:hypothetical protein
MRLAPVGIVAVLLLEGCATQSTVPSGISDEEAGRLLLVALASDTARLQEAIPGSSISLQIGDELSDNWEDWIGLQVQCLEAAGFDPVSVTDTGFMIGGDEDRVLEARLHCKYRFPLDPRLLGALSSEQAQWAWDYWDTRLIPCVEALGYTVPGVPQRDEFVRQAVGRIGPLPWTPYLAMRVQSNQEKAAVDAVCPPLPADPYQLYASHALPTLIVLPGR